MNYNPVYLKAYEFIFCKPAPSLHSQLTTPHKVFERKVATEHIRTAHERCGTHEDEEQQQQQQQPTSFEFSSEVVLKFLKKIKFFVHFFHC